MSSRCFTSEPTLNIAILSFRYLVSRCGLNLDFSDGKVEYIFICLLAFQCPSFENCPFKSLEYLFTELPAFFLWFYEFFYILALSLLLLIFITNISVVWHFILFMVPFYNQASFILMQTHLSIFFFDWHFLCFKGLFLYARVPKIFYIVF